MLREALEDAEEGTDRVPFVGSARIANQPSQVAAEIRTVIGVTEDQQRRCKGPGALLRAAAERAGAFVLLLGDVGSYHSDIGENVFRSFALADELVPFVVINDSDAEAARPFA